MRTFGDLNAGFLLGANLGASVGWCSIPIGAAGAPGAVSGIPGVTLTRTGTGAYTMVFPAVPKDMIVIPLVVKSAAPTVFDIVMTALAPQAGTGGFTCCAANGSAVDPANGDTIGFLFLARHVGGG